MDALRELPGTVQFSCFHKTGEGPWSGTVVIKNGPELEIEELKDSWRVTPVSSEGGGKTSVTERSLERALLKAAS